jgi:hypothetical protein
MWLICIDTQQKRTKKTNFYVVPNLFSRLGGILDWGALLVYPITSPFILFLLI